MPLSPADSSYMEPLLGVDEDASEEVERDVESNVPDVEHIRSSPTTPLPKLQLFVLLYMQFAEPMTTHVMGPFIVQLVLETGITNGDVTKVGYYTGIIDSLFYLAEALTILQWGRLSDRIGRRPVLLIGLFGLSLSMFLFGLAHAFWLVVASRAIGGLLNGNIGVIKSTIGELTDDTNVAQAFAMLPITFALGNTLAPLIGGSLQHPYEQLGGVFLTEFWHANPYFLPCVTVALVSISAFLACVFLLRETAPCRIKGSSTKDPLYLPIETDTSHATSSEVPMIITEHTPLLSLKESESGPPLRSLLTPRVLLVIINYSILGVIEVAFAILQPLVLSTPIQHGGLGMSPSTIGVCMATFGITNGAVSALFFAPFARAFGIKTVTTAGAAAYFGCYALFPLMNALAKIEEKVTSLVWIVLFAQLSLATLPPMAFGSIFIYLTHAAPSRSALGATNGLAQTITSIMRSFGPAGATALFALSIKRNLLGGNLVYIVLCLLAIFAVMLTRLFPAKPWDRIND
ncbi:member of major facilitator superfamily multidrug-resistance, DHA1 sub-family [Ramaria rubella]|nr:member of major facilitator superfamily multidrug-resistance, DHA1 sub-family [Ramaria rubella]